MKVSVLYIGSSLLAPLKNAERELNHEYNLNLTLTARNFGSPLSDDEWQEVDRELNIADLVFVIHVMDGENAARLLSALDKYEARHRAVIVINCMPELMRRIRMGRLNIARYLAHDTSQENEKSEESKKGFGKAAKIFSTTASWVGLQVGSGKAGGKAAGSGHTKYLKLVDRLPGILKFVPNAGGLRDIKNYLNIFCYFLQPTPANIRAMVLYALKEYIPDQRLKDLKIKVAPPEHLPSVAIYHPRAPKLFESFDEYRKWYESSSPKSRVQGSKSKNQLLDPESTIGLLLMRPQVVSKTTRHYDALISALEAEGLSVIPALSTLMDNREACERFFVEKESHVPRPTSVGKSNVQRPTSNVKDKEPSTKHQVPSTKPKSQTTNNGQLTTDRSRVSQIVSLTGFSFVGGPAMNDSEAAAEFLQHLNRPYRSAVSLDTQTIDAWEMSQTGLNPVQAGMQIAIPETDGATEPFIYGGIPGCGIEPVALADRCARLARRLQRWNRLHTAARSELRLGLILFCFPPNKGNIGTAADLDVFPSVWNVLQKLEAEGYSIAMPRSADALRDQLLSGNADNFAATCNVAHRMSVDEYRRVCPYVDEVEKEWGPAPGNINSFGRELLIQGLHLGSVFVGVQPTFGYEGDPMRLMMARGGSPHHGFMAFYAYLSQVRNVDAVIHVGTHGAMEFMPGKQVGLSADCWPDRLIGELPNIYLYSVNNPSEGSIAKRRSYAALISYLTPPIENAGLYKDFRTLKDLVMSYRQTTEEAERDSLFEVIEKTAEALNL